MTRVRKPAPPKCCKDCGKVKPARQFYRHPTYADGRMSSCKDCKRAYEREAYELKRASKIEAKRIYNQSERGKQVRRRYLESGGRDLYNETRRMLYRVRMMDANG